MTRKAERALIRSARQYHAAPVTVTVKTHDEPLRYAVALDVWDDPEQAARELDRSLFTRATRRAH